MADQAVAVAPPVAGGGAQARAAEGGTVAEDLCIRRVDQMKTVTFWDCEKCGHRYTDPAMAAQCEAYHFKPTTILEVKWDPQEEFPTLISVEGPCGQPVLYVKYEGELE